MISELMAMSRVTGISQTYVDDVFISFTRTGTGASQVTTTNIDMTKGYALWSKGRSGITDHSIYHSARGVTKDLVTNTTAAETTEAQGLTAVSSTGHTYGTLAKTNTNAATYVDWVFRNAPNFYHHDVVVKTGGSNATYNFSMHTAGLGMVRVKRTDVAGSWYIWHRSLTAGKLLIGETTAAEATLGHITISGTTVTLIDGVIADGTYLVEAFAHDTSANSLIQCGSFTTDASGNFALQNLGWEPQYILQKQVSNVSGWFVNDTSRGSSFTNTLRLFANTSEAEANLGTGYLTFNATGFSGVNGGWGSSTTYIYLAICRPNKPPTVGTQVYNAIARTGTGAAATVTGVGFAPDSAWTEKRAGALTLQTCVMDRLRGGIQNLQTTTMNAEGAIGTSAFGTTMDGIAVGIDNENNRLDYTYINYFFRRAPGIFEEVCYTGTGTAHTETHNLGAVPELMIVKVRTSPDNWAVYHVITGNTSVSLFNTADATYTNLPTWWNSTTPTNAVFSIGTSNSVNANGSTYVAYLFATLAGISKVGSYTGNGTSQTINCGFATGARFILIKRTDLAGDWFIWDTVRGIVAGNDPHLRLNTTVVEVTTADSIDPDTSGFIVNQLAATDINVTSATYVFLAIA